MINIKAIKQVSRDLLYSFLGRVTYDDSIRIKEIAKEYLPCVESMDYSLVLKQWRDDNLVTCNYYPEDVDKVITKTLLCGALEDFQSKVFKDGDRVKRKYIKFVENNAILFYTRIDDIHDDETISHVYIERNLPATSYLIGSRFRGTTNV